MLFPFKILSGKKLKNSCDYFAPVFVSQKIKINAKPETIWVVIYNSRNLAHWKFGVPRFIPFKERINTNSYFKESTYTIPVDIHTFNPYTNLGWKGKMTGISFIKNWWFCNCDEGTEIMVEVSLNGFLPWLFKPKLQKIAEVKMKLALREVKTALEQASY